MVSRFTMQRASRPGFQPDFKRGSPALHTLHQFSRTTPGYAAPALSSSIPPPLDSHHSNVTCAPKSVINNCKNGEITIIETNYPTKLATARTRSAERRNSPGLQ